MSQNLKLNNFSIVDDNGNLVDVPVIGDNSLAFKATIENISDSGNTILLSIAHYIDDKMLDNVTKLYDINSGESLVIEENYTFIRSQHNDVLKIILLDNSYKPICNNIKRPYLINSKSDFENIKEDLGITYYLESDIDLGDDYEPFEFYGNLIGNNYTIRYNINSINDYLGLFSKITNSATIKDLDLIGSINAINTSTSKFIGSICGTVETSNTTHSIDIRNVLLDIDIITDGKSGTFVGGIIGSTYPSDINVNIMLDNLIYTGSISKLSESGGYVGGIIGCSRHDISNSIMRGTLSVNNNCKVGGICAFYYGLNKTISNCAVYGHNDNLVNESYGTILGTVERNCSIDCCYSIDQQIPFVNKAGNKVTKEGIWIKYSYSTGSCRNLRNDNDEELIKRTWVYDNKNISDVNQTNCPRLDFNTIYKMSSKNTHVILRGNTTFETYQDDLSANY